MKMNLDLMSACVWKSSSAECFWGKTEGQNLQANDH